ncbi:MAG TPA: hypothetical protein VFZ57_10700 [Thermoanaerobaculia bacterium]|nr:hypothetical protein [Thermoanaerobaculia bacterium]
MITGFNTDVKHETRVFHVQTEDRGLANPVVESLVYVGGEILLSKKSPYGDLISGDRVDEKALREMMDLQHRRVIEAVRRGRLDKGKVGEAPPDWADDTLPHPHKVSPAALAAVSAMLSAPPEPLPGDQPAPAKPVRVTATAAMPAPAPPPPTPAAPPPARAAAAPPDRPAPAVPPARPAAPAPPAPTRAAAAPPDRPAPAGPPARPAAPQKPRSGAGLRSLDQVIVDYLASEAASEHLEIAFSADAALVSGETVTLTVKASTSLTEKPLAGAHVSMRVVSTLRPPQILFRGVTGADGVVKSVCALPDIGTGNAALIIAASSGLGNNEIKQLIRKKPR